MKLGKTSYGSLSVREFRPMYLLLTGNDTVPINYSVVCRRCILYCQVAVCFSLCICQGGHRALKVLEKIVHFSRIWKALANSVGPLKVLKSQ